MPKTKAQLLWEVVFGMIAWGGILSFIALMDQGYYNK